MNILGQRIKALRNDKKVSQSELGDYLSVGKTTISNYETGYSAPDNEVLARLSKFFSVSTDYLLGLTNERINPVDQALSDDPELQAFWNTMREREDLQLMFKKSKTLSPDAIKQIVGIIKLIEDKEDEEFGG